MNEQVFTSLLSENKVIITEQQQVQFEKYYQALTDWNKKVNLTAITEKEGVYLKHFYDSISPSFYFPFQDIKTVCDVGAGAGFPSLPLKICFPHIHVTIVDSLRKRIEFLEYLCDLLQLSNITLIHARAEDFGRKRKNREHFDLVTARAVANMAVLTEYCLPMCKINGHFIALKGSKVEEEVVGAKNAIHLLGGEVQEIVRFNLPMEKSGRSIVIVKKIKQTRKQYPRRAGIPAKQPIQ